MQTKLLNKYAHQIAHNQECREQLAHPTTCNMGESTQRQALVTSDQAEGERMGRAAKHWACCVQARSEQRESLTPRGAATRVRRRVGAAPARSSHTAGTAAGTLSAATAWTDLEDTRLSEISQSPRDKRCTVPLTQGAQSPQVHRDKT